MKIVNRQEEHMHNTQASLGVRIILIAQMQAHIHLLSWEDLRKALSKGLDPVNFDNIKETLKY